MYKLKENKNIEEIFSKIFFIEQFTSQEKKIFHIYNFLYPLTESKKDIKERKEFIGKKIRLYIPNLRVSFLNKIEKKYIKYLKSFNNSCNDKIRDLNTGNAMYFHPHCFTHIQDIIDLEDLTYKNSYKKNEQKRYITIKELTYFINAITRKIFNSEEKVAKLSRKWFLNKREKNGDRKKDFSYDYMRGTGKNLNTNKLTHLIQVCSKYKYLHITLDNTNVFRIGENNPYYKWNLIPDIIEVDETIITKDKVIENLQNKVRMMVKENMEQRLNVDMLTDNLATVNSEVEYLKEELRRNKIISDELNKIVDNTNLISGEKNENKRTTRTTENN